MSYPENPDTIIIKNKFYKNSLKELDLWNYYQKVKRDLLKETFNRDLMVFIATDIGKTIIRRKLKTGQNIRMTSRNYDTLITSRSISWHSSMNNIENFGIIDIDIDPLDRFITAQTAANDVYNFAINDIPNIKNVQIRFTGKTSFHILCEFNQKNKIDNIRFLLQRLLMGSDLNRKYLINEKRRRGVINLDLSINKFRGNFITLHSLSVLGLKCVNVKYHELMRFNPFQARI